MTINVVMQAPTGFGGVVEGTPSGTVYQVPASGTVTNINPLDVPTFLSLGFQTIGPVTNIGTANTAAGVTAVEFGNAYQHTTVLTIGAPAALPNIPGGADLGLGLLLYTLPAGAVLVTSSYLDVGLTQTVGNLNADTPTVGLGTTIASGVIAVLSGTAAFQNISVGIAAANCIGTPTVQTVGVTVSPFTLPIKASGGLNHTVYFNAAFDWDASGDPGLLVAGTVVLNWNYMGPN